MSYKKDVIHSHVSLQLGLAIGAPTHRWDVVVLRQGVLSTPELKTAFLITQPQRLSFQSEDCHTKFKTNGLKRTSTRNHVLYPPVNVHMIHV